MEDSPTNSTRTDGVSPTNPNHDKSKRNLQLEVSVKRQDIKDKSPQKHRENTQLKAIKDTQLPSLQ